LTEYHLVVIRVEDGTLIYNGTFASSLIARGNIDLTSIISSLNVLTCRYTYTFELSALRGSMSSGVQLGNSNFDGMSHNLIVVILG